ncbi:hypothetical protein [Fischerella muscicola]|uniref:hypothetical protein n=1 Tax=Fischerella muscicola TaxID=92938 RepID=UPI0011AED9F7|nr:hypothetical protein [Fischerella muscicola]
MFPLQLKLIRHPQQFSCSWVVSSNDRLSNCLAWLYPPEAIAQKGDAMCDRTYGKPNLLSTSTVIFTHVK